MIRMGSLGMRFWRGVFLGKGEDDLFKLSVVPRAFQRKKLSF
jgi:hypothetical protein